MKFVAWFGEDEDDAGVIGGKSVTLGELTRVGIPVPSGFCVTCPQTMAAVTREGSV